MRRRRKLLWQLYPSYLIIVVLSVTALGWYASRVLRELDHERSVAKLTTEAFLIEKLVHGLWSVDKGPELDYLLKEIRSKTSDRITLILPSGKVLADTHFDTDRLGQHAGRPEVKKALGGEISVAKRPSFSLSREMTYLAVPVNVDNRLAGVIRVAMPESALTGLLSKLQGELLLAGVIIVMLSAAVSLYVAQRINRPLAQMRIGAAKFAAGDLQHRLELPNSEEFEALAAAMNEMAAQLDSRIRKITRQRNELEAVLSGMVEAVLVVDNNQRVSRINQAAEQLFQISEIRVKDRTVQEAVRNTEFQRFVRRTLSSSEPVEGDLRLLGDPDQFLQAHGALLKDSQGAAVGAVVVLNDVTRMKTLENIRRDFVANVSHELKTPITTIKGFLETLKDGAAKDPESAERFLDIIIRHANRLNSIIEDLLSLSRIERYAERGEIALETHAIEEVFDAVKRTCLKKARHKEIQLEFDAGDQIYARMNPTLLEQAVENLVDNAIKYSETGKMVRVRAVKGPNDIMITVEDQGSGIAREHLTRIFERFYRVDKARSRKVGGTGLGLAIVKHIATAHNGRVTVESSPGDGSTFSIHLPIE